MRILTLILFALPLPALAEMNAEEFEAYVTGRTLTYADGGVTYGIEEYLPNRRVRWSFIGDQCEDGYWYENAGQICFIYENRPNAPQCWVFTQEQGQLSATFANQDDGHKLYAIKRTDKPMLCKGPDVGV